MLKLYCSLSLWCCWQIVWNYSGGRRGPLKQNHHIFSAQKHKIFHKIDFIPSGHFLCHYSCILYSIHSRSRDETSEYRSVRVSLHLAHKNFSFLRHIVESLRRLKYSNLLFTSWNWTPILKCVTCIMLREEFCITAVLCIIQTCTLEKQQRKSFTLVNWLWKLRVLLLHLQEGALKRCR